ncbi:response regulator containing a CheY-like receiver domain and an HTH DNA-binding domain [Longilinea arvoryzae]|uniref:Response regulator containing a CheY-like receiver domain and an HTH DNA-binding domain n=1 Tax=Longilinea arvoryzae TaxID=360412 RepID=A0A0S7BC60_9CHLR|nr:helix-turn-helix transcriptional regulator [Longilinea arvoryzae]GAP12877.1 response regulator containing a CheY-like receiver domain and an HTH DNA-binding domain [Longilinea arvoryzae]
MTHIIFLPDDHTLLQLEAAETTEELLASIGSGRWRPPEPYASIFSANFQGNPFCAVRQGSLVVVMLSRTAAAAIGLGPDLPDAGNRPAFSPRQMEVLHGLAEGQTTRQIAARLGLTPRMVQYHVSEIKRHLGARSRAQSVSRAQALGMVRRKV